MQEPESAPAAESLLSVRLDLRRLTCFVAVSRELSFTRAAQRLRIAQPWLSAQVRKLESEVGVALFDRSTRHVELTDAGRDLLPQATRLLAEAARTAAAIETLRRGQCETVRVGAPGYSFEAPGRNAAVERFRQRHPNIEIDIRNGWTTQLLGALRAGEIDVAFALWPFDADGLETLVIDRAVLHVVMPGDDPLAAHEHLKLADLAGHRLILFKRCVNPVLFDYEAEYCRRAGLEVCEPPEATLEAMHGHAMRHGLLWFSTDWASEMQILPRGRVMRRLDDPELDFVLHLAIDPVTANARARRFWRVVQESAEANITAVRSRIGTPLPAS
jgi:DNA-binding transcriptional LysR family regulator